MCIRVIEHTQQHGDFSSAVWLCRRVGLLVLVLVAHGPFTLIDNAPLALAHYNALAGLLIGMLVSILASCYRYQQAATSRAYATMLNAE
jgi:hypothetical protein